jgi:hypothetical protein
MPRVERASGGGGPLRQRPDAYATNAAHAADVTARRGPPKETRDRIGGCHDPEIQRRRLVRAVNAPTLEDVFAVE